MLPLTTSPDLNPRRCSLPSTNHRLRLDPDAFFGLEPMHLDDLLPVAGGTDGKVSYRRRDPAIVSRSHRESQLLPGEQGTNSHPLLTFHCSRPNHNLTGS